MRPVLPDVEQEQWTYLPGQALEVVAALTTHGCATQSDGRIEGWNFVHFAKEGAPEIKAAVERRHHASLCDRPRYAGLGI